MALHIVRRFVIKIALVVVSINHECTVLQFAKTFDYQYDHSCLYCRLNQCVGSHCYYYHMAVHSLKTLRANTFVNTSGTSIFKQKIFITFTIRKHFFA